MTRLFRTMAGVLLLTATGVAPAPAQDCPGPVASYQVRVAGAGLFGVDVLAWLARVRLNRRKRDRRLRCDGGLHDRRVFITTDECRAVTDGITRFVSGNEPRLESPHRGIKR